MIQLDVRLRTPRARKFVGGVGWLTPTTYIQLAGVGSIFNTHFGRSCVEAMEAFTDVTELVEEFGLEM